MVKRILKISGIVVATILLSYFFYGSYIFLQPRLEVMHFASGIHKIGTWSDEYIHNGAWTATNGSRYIYKTIDTTLLDPSTYNADCECYQWKKHIQQHWYFISVCPEYKMIFINRYFHGILDIMEERRIAKIKQQTPKNAEDEFCQDERKEIGFYDFFDTAHVYSIDSLNVSLKLFDVCNIFIKHKTEKNGDYLHIIDAVNFEPAYFLTDKGIAIHFPHYCIGAYSDDEWDIVIPYDLILNYVRPQWKEKL